MPHIFQDEDRDKTFYTDEAKANAAIEAGLITFCSECSSEFSGRCVYHPTDDQVRVCQGQDHGGPIVREGCGQIFRDDDDRDDGLCPACAGLPDCADCEREHGPNYAGACPHGADDGR